MTDQPQPQPVSKLAIVTALYEEYVSPRVPNPTPTEMAAAVKATPAFQKAFSMEQDADRAARKLATKTMPNVDIPAWLIDGDFEKTDFKKNPKTGEREKVPVGRGMLLLLPDGSRHFQNLGGPLAPPMDTLAEFVFPGGEATFNLLSKETTYGRPPATSKPVAKKHNINPPSTSLGPEMKKAFKMTRKGYISGESYDPILVVGTITTQKEDIRLFAANERGPASLTYWMQGREGTWAIVEADVQAACNILGFSEATPLQTWKDTLAGQPIVANGKLSLFVDRPDGDFWGGDGTLAQLAAQLAANMRPKGEKRPGESYLSFEGMTRQVPDPANPGKTIDEPVACIAVGKRWLYRLETYFNGDNELVYKGWARADQELDRDNRPTPPTLNCVVESGVSKRAKQPYTMNEGAFVTYLNFVAGKPEPKGSAFQGVFDL